MCSWAGFWYTYTVNATTIPHDFVIATTTSQIFTPDVIISGGQCGADKGALLGAEAVGISTGGYAPKGYRTEDGPQPELLARFGLVEHESTDYNQRTYSNVEMCDAIILVARNFMSAGTLLTMEFARRLGKPLFEVHHPALQRLESEFLLKDIHDWLMYHKPSILNFAGNRESKAKGIENYTKGLVVRLFS